MNTGKSDEIMRTWTILSVQLNNGYMGDPNDLEAIYDIFLESGERYVLGVQEFYKNIEPLSVYFEVGTLEEIVNKSFDAPYSNAELAFMWLLNELKPYRQTLPPNKFELFGKAVRDLAQMRCPDFTSYDEDDVFKVFNDIFGQRQDIKAWFESIREEVFKQSRNQVRIELAERSEFTVTVSGKAIYFKLIKNGKEQKAFVGPSSTPFIFEK